MINFIMTQVHEVRAWILSASSTAIGFVTGEGKEVVQTVYQYQFIDILECVAFIVAIISGLLAAFVSIKKLLKK